MNAYSSLTVAKRFLEIAHERGESLTPMQVLKLVYIAHGWMLGLCHRPLIRESVQAWQYGPVIKKLYDALRKYGGGHITDPIQYNGEVLDEQARDIVDQVYDTYGQKSGPALSRLTHAPGTPWSQVYDPDSFGIIISDDLIEDHYAKKAEGSAQG